MHFYAYRSHMMLWVDGVLSDQIMTPCLRIYTTQGYRPSGHISGTLKSKFPNLSCFDVLETCVSELIFAYFGECLRLLAHTYFSLRTLTSACAH